MVRLPYLVGHLVHLHGYSGESTLCALDPRVLPHLDMSPLQARRVLGQVLEAANFNELAVPSFLPFVKQTLVCRLQPLLRRQKLLQLPCEPNC